MKRIRELGIDILGMIIFSKRIVTDYEPAEATWNRECAETLADLPAFLSGIHCPLEILEKREFIRTQFERVYAHTVYDFKVDTSTYSEEECCRRISAYIYSGKQPFALRQLQNLL